MTPAINYDRKVPEELRQALDPLLARWAALIPTWCHDLRICYDDTGNEAAAMGTHAKPHYRFAQIFVYPIWLTAEPVLREEYLVHELLHLSTWQMSEFARELLDGFVPQESVVLAHLEEEAAKYREAAVQDLTYSLMTLRDAWSV